MTAEPRIWQLQELEGHLDELFQRAAAGEAQEVRDGDGRAFTVQLRPTGFVSGLSLYDEALRGDDFQPERLSGQLRDVEL